MTPTVERMSLPFCIALSGPSGAGKTTIVERLLERDDAVRLSVSLTTRPPRAGEESGREYVFVDRQEFESRRAAGEFAEWAEVHGNLYGTPRAGLRERLARGEDVLLDIDYQGGLAIKRAFPDTVAIFLLPPSMQVLEERLRGRASDDEYQIMRRLEVAAHEISHAGQYDFVVVNHDVERTYAAVAEIVHSERRRVSRIDPARLEGWGGAPRPA